VLSSTTATTRANITKANQSISWSAPAALTYGTPLSSGQLDATVTGVPGGTPIGTVTYNPRSGSILTAGLQSLTVNVASTTNYNADSASVLLTVNMAMPTMALPVVTSSRGSSTITETLTGVTGGAVPTGTVTFNLGTELLGTASINKNGVATLTIKTVISGKLLAVYSGDANYSVASVDPVVSGTKSKHVPVHHKHAPVHHPVARIVRHLVKLFNGR